MSTRKQLASNFNKLLWPLDFGQQDIDFQISLASSVMSSRVPAFRSELPFPGKSFEPGGEQAAGHRAQEGGSGCKQNSLGPQFAAVNDEADRQQANGQHKPEQQASAQGRAALPAAGAKSRAERRERPCEKSRRLKRRNLYFCQCDESCRKRQAQAGRGGPEKQGRCKVSRRTAASSV